MDAQVLFVEMLKKGVILRPVKNYGLNNFLRMSVGTMEENQFAISSLTAILASGSAS